MLKIITSKGAMGDDHRDTAPIAAIVLYDLLIEWVEPTRLALIGQDRLITKGPRLLSPLIDKMLIRHRDDKCKLTLALVETGRCSQRGDRLPCSGRHLQQPAAAVGKPSVNRVNLIVTQRHDRWRDGARLSVA